MSCGGFACGVRSCFDCHSSTLTPILFALAKILEYEIVQSTLKEIWKAFNEWLQERYGGWNEILTIAFDKGAQAAISALETAKDVIIAVCKENQMLLDQLAKLSTKVCISSAVATKQVIKTTADLSVQQGTKQATTQAAMNLVAAKSGTTQAAAKLVAAETTQAAMKLFVGETAKSGTTQAAITLGTAQTTKSIAKEVVKASIIKPPTVIKATKLVAATPVAMGTSKAIIKNAVTPLNIIADVAQVGLEAHGYKKVGKTVGATGNIVAGAMAGSVTGPAGAVVGAAVGAGVWMAGEMMGKLIDRAFGDRSTGSEQVNCVTTPSSASENEPPSPVNQISGEDPSPRQSEGVPTLPSASENKPPSPLNQINGDQNPEGGTPQSTYYSEAKKIPLMCDITLECGSSGLEHTFKDHDITLHIPEGAVAENQVINIEVGVAMYGQFIFPNDTQPISPIVWLHIESGEMKIKKPFQLILPHFLIGLTKDQLREHNVCFGKASLIYGVEDDDMKYEFKPCECKPLFASIGKKSYAILQSDHSCFYCLQANKTPELVQDASFCLTRIISLQTNEVYFIATYFLNVCIDSEALKEEFLTKSGYIISHHDHFKFKESHLKFICSGKQQDMVISLEPSTAQINASDVGFSFCEMHNRPCVKMTVSMVNSGPFNIRVRVTGCSDESQLDMDIAFPSKVTPSAHNGSHLLHCQSHTIVRGDDKPSLRDALGKLLPLAAHWRNIGALLGIKDSILQRIRCDEGRCCNCLQDMLSEWCNTVDPPPTWNALTEATEHIDEAKAREIRKYIAE